MKEPQELEMNIAAEDALLEQQNETLKIIAEIYQIREHNRKCIIPAVICGVVFFIFFLLFFMENDFRLAEQYGQWIPTAELILFILGYAGLFIFLKKVKWKKATELFKSKLVPAIIEEEFDEVTYIPDEGVSLVQAVNMKVVHCGNSLSSEDYIEGDYKGYHFALSECCAQELRNRSYDTVFFGKILDLDYDNEAVVDVYVCGKNFSYPLNPVQAAKQTVDMESVLFNQCYTVYCGQKEMAFYVLTPQVQEALLELGEKMNYDIAMNFSGKRLYVAITDKRNTLELPSNYYINYKAERIRIKQELSMIKTVLESLPLRSSEGMLRYLIDGYKNKNKGININIKFDTVLANLSMAANIVLYALIVISVVFIFIVCLLF